MNDIQKRLFKYVFIYLYSRPKYDQKNIEYSTAREFIQSLDIKKELSEKDAELLQNYYDNYLNLSDQTSFGIVLAIEAFKNYIEKKND